MHILFLEILQNTDFSRNAKGFFFIFSLVIGLQNLFPKILILLVIYTDFVLDQRGRSALYGESVVSLSLRCSIREFERQQQREILNSGLSGFQVVTGYW